MYILPHFFKKRATIKKEEEEEEKSFWLLWKIRDGSAVVRSQTRVETGERVRSGRLGACSGSWG